MYSCMINSLEYEPVNPGPKRAFEQSGRSLSPTNPTAGTSSFAYDELPQGYIALEQVLQKLEADYLNRQAIREKMLTVLEEANRLSARHEPEIASRIAVAFFSEGVGEH